MLISCVYNSIMAPNGQIPKSQESKGKTRTIFLPFYYFYLMMTMRLKLWNENGIKYHGLLYHLFNWISHQKLKNR